MSLFYWGFWFWWVFAEHLSVGHWAIFSSTIVKPTKYKKWLRGRCCRAIIIVLRRDYGRRLCGGEETAKDVAESMSVFCAAISRCRRSLVAKLEFPKLRSGVRFSSPAPKNRKPVTVAVAGFSFCFRAICRSRTRTAMHSQFVSVLLCTSFFSHLNIFSLSKPAQGK